MFNLKFQSLFFLFVSFIIPVNLNAEELIIKSFGHSQYLIKGEGKSVLINPFKAIGCASNLEETINLKKDLILASSRLLDEGYNPNDDLMFVDPGTYEFKNIYLNGISLPHDRLNGRRYGMATVWTWNQSDFKIVHMGGAAGPISFEDQILINRPDILFISIGGGIKSYTGKEASEIIEIINPNIIVPVHYLKNKNKFDDCDFSDEKQFLDSISGYKIKYVGNQSILNSKVDKEKIIYFFKK